MKISNNLFKSCNRPGAAIAILLVTASMLALKKTHGSFSELWFTPDQQAQSLMNRGEFAAAAERSQNSMLRGTALYKDGQFEEALNAFNTVTSTEGIYNRGNCQVMLGKYDAAIELYNRALEQRPEWKEARENLDLAIARKKAIAPPDDDAGGTGGQLEADEIVFDNRAKNSNNEEVLEAGVGDKMSDEEMRAIWLRKVETKPADFLRNKFSYQLQFSESDNKEEEE